MEPCEQAGRIASENPVGSDTPVLHIRGDEMLLLEVVAAARHVVRDDGMNSLLWRELKRAVDAYEAAVDQAQAKPDIPFWKNCRLNEES